MSEVFMIEEKSAFSRGIRIVIEAVSNGFIIECEGRTFVIQSESDDVCEIENALSAVSTIYSKIKASRK